MPGAMAAYKFQSTPPAWGATDITVPPQGVGVFQSTPPAWGATHLGRRVGIADEGVSIHAPRVGGDLQACRVSVCLIGFQSTPPAWGATSLAGIVIR